MLFLSLRGTNKRRILGQLGDDIFHNGISDQEKFDIITCPNIKNTLGFPKIHNKQ